MLPWAGGSVGWSAVPRTEQAVGSIPRQGVYKGD